MTPDPLYVEMGAGYEKEYSKCDICGVNFMYRDGGSYYVGPCITIDPVEGLQRDIMFVPLCDQCSPRRQDLIRV